jgi:hypothetical protein
VFDKMDAEKLQWVQKASFKPNIQTFVNFMNNAKNKFIISNF